VHGNCLLSAATSACTGALGPSDEKGASGRICHHQRPCGSAAGETPLPRMAPTCCQRRACRRGGRVKVDGGEIVIGQMGVGVARGPVKRGKTKLVEADQTVHDAMRGHADSTC
jgi:hypothetical protein